MPYVRQRGNQLAIVHGARDPDSGKVEQRILFTFYSKAEALEALGRRGKNGDSRFQSLLEHQYPELRFNWKKILQAVDDNMDVLPDLYKYKTERLQKSFRQDLIALTRQLTLADPQLLFSSANLIRDHRIELEYLAELIQWRLKLCEQEKSEWNNDNPFYWRYSMQGAGVPSEAEEQAAHYYEQGDYERASVVFKLLIECFDDYAEGYNYLGLIAYDEHQLEEALAYFEKTIELGRKLFPKRIAKSRYWSDHKTRPYMRGLRNSVLTLNELGRFDEALALCDRLEKECGDDVSAAAYRAAISLNTGHWRKAADAATYRHKVWASESFIAAFALHEIGNRQDAAAMFLHGALNHPRAAKMILGMRSPKPRNREEARDHNVGVHHLRSLQAYLGQQSRRAKKFFRDFVRHPQADALLTESMEVVVRWNAQHPTGEREAFDRMQLMHTPEFARNEARAIMSDIGGKKVQSLRAQAQG
jgi:tetratricopeptide (TPR) repeat protein